MDRYSIFLVVYKYSNWMREWVWYPAGFAASFRCLLVNIAPSFFPYALVLTVNLRYFRGTASTGGLASSSLIKPAGYLSRSVVYRNSMLFLFQMFCSETWRSWKNVQKASKRWYRPGDVDYSIGFRDMFERLLLSRRSLNLKSWRAYGVTEILDSICNRVTPLKFWLTNAYVNRDSAYSRHPV